MSGFAFNGSTACAPSIVPPPAATPEAVITNDGWFPDIDPAKLRAAYRVGDKITPERLREAILAAIITVGNDLLRFRQANADSAALAVVPAVQLGGESRLVLLYRRAIGCYAKADLIESNSDIDTTAAGLARAADLDPSVDELRRDGRHAIRDMLGLTRTDVELI